MRQYNCKSEIRKSVDLSFKDHTSFDKESVKLFNFLKIFILTGLLIRSFTKLKINSINPLVVNPQYLVCMAKNFDFNKRRDHRKNFQ